jgi:hypothetical protein
MKLEVKKLEENILFVIPLNFSKNERQKIEKDK